MKPPAPWLSRNWNFQIDPRLLPCFLDRLAGAPARIEEKVANINPALLTHKPDDKWSIQEHIGHLLDLEELGMGRIEDFRNKKPAMRAADMSNRKTFEGNYNARPIGELLTEFRAERERLVKAFWELDDETLEWTSLHPRLQKPMLVADFAHFHAEHDDHHLAAMAWLMFNLE